MASGNQTNSGTWADFPQAPRNSNRASAVSHASPGPPPACTVPMISPISRVPKAANSPAMPSRNPASPMRLTMNAFLPASDALCLWNQKPISR